MAPAPAAPKPAAAAAPDAKLDLSELTAVSPLDGWVRGWDELGFRGVVNWEPMDGDGAMCALQG